MAVTRTGAALAAGGGILLALACGARTALPIDEGASGDTEGGIGALADASNDRYAQRDRGVPDAPPFDAMRLPRCEAAPPGDAPSRRYNLPSRFDTATRSWPL